MGVHEDRRRAGGGGHLKPVNAPNALSRLALSIMSPRTTVAPCASSEELSEVGRTRQRTGVPFPSRECTTCRPTLPVAPTTRVSAVEPAIDMELGAGCAAIDSHTYVESASCVSCVQRAWRDVSHHTAPCARRRSAMAWCPRSTASVRW